MRPLSVKSHRLLNSPKELFGDVMNWITQIELLRGLKPKCIYSLSAVLGKLTKACFRGIMSFMSRALTPTGGGGSAAGSTSSDLWQHKFFSMTRVAAASRIIADAAQTDTSCFTHTYCRRQQSCCDPEGRAAEVSPLWVAVNPPTLPGSAHVITPASNELPSQSRCTLENNQEAHETPTASWSSFFFFLLLLILFLNFSAINNTSNLIKKKLTNTWYFLFFCMSEEWTQSFTPRPFCPVSISVLLKQYQEYLLFQVSLQCVRTVEAEILLILNSGTNRLSTCQSQCVRRDRGSWAPKISTSLAFCRLRAAEACCSASWNISISIAA